MHLHVPGQGAWEPQGLLPPALNIMLPGGEAEAGGRSCGLGVGLVGWVCGLQTGRTAPHQHPRGGCVTARLPSGYRPAPTARAGLGPKGLLAAASMDGGLMPTICHGPLGLEDITQGLQTAEHSSRKQAQAPREPQPKWVAGGAEAGCS